MLGESSVRLGQKPFHPSNGRAFAYFNNNRSDGEDVFCWGVPVPIVGFGFSWKYTVQGEGLVENPDSWYMLYYIMSNNTDINPFRILCWKVEYTIYLFRILFTSCLR